MVDFCRQKIKSWVDLINIDDDKGDALQGINGVDDGA